MSVASFIWVKWALPSSRLCCSTQRRRQRSFRGNWWWGERVARLPASHSLAAKMEGSLQGGAEIRGKPRRQTACQLLWRDCQNCYSGDCEPGKHFLAQFQAENELLLRGGGAG